MLSEDLKKRTFSCCQTRIPVGLRWEENTSTRIQYILKHTALSQTYTLLDPRSRGIPGNKRVDRVAKAALLLPISLVKISVTDFLPRDKLLMRREWQAIWNCCDGNKLHAVIPTVGVTKQRDAVIINRLQIGHTRATHVHLLGDDEAFCATCYTSLTVNHIFIECPQFNHLRRQYHFGSTLKELFNYTSVHDIIAFIKDTQFIYSHIIVVVFFCILAISLGFNKLFLLEY